jgi:hypothetical protein
LSEWLTLEDIEKRIQEYYLWWFQVAPGVTPQIDGELYSLWELFYTYVDDDGELREKAA